MQIFINKEFYGSGPSQVLAEYYHTKWSYRLVLLLAPVCFLTASIDLISSLVYVVEVNMQT